MYARWRSTGIVLALISFTLLSSTPVRAAASHEVDRSTLVRQASTLFPGDQIRVVSPKGRERTPGWFASLEGDSALQMRLAKSEPPVSIGFDQIGSVEKKVGTQHHAGAGAMIGLVVGVAVGAVLGSKSEASADFLAPPKETVIAGGAIAGMIVGGVVGALTKSDRYEPVSRESR